MLLFKCRVCGKEIYTQIDVGTTIELRQSDKAPLMIWRCCIDQSCKDRIKQIAAEDTERFYNDTNPTTAE